MNYKILILIFILLFGCTNTNINKSTNNIIPSEIYSNKGFTLLYEDELKKKRKVDKRIDPRSLIIFQRNLKVNTSVKVTNLLNDKSILAKVGHNSKYPNFYNSVISQRIYDELDLNKDEPYVQISSISENTTFLAKKTKMYDEEKQVADKAPVDGISINDISTNKKKSEKNQKKDKFSYIIKIADFYYEDSAKMMQKRIEQEVKINSSNIENISSTTEKSF